MELEHKLKKRLTVGILTHIAIWVMLFAVYYFSEGLYLLGIVESFLVLVNIFLIVMMIIYKYGALFYLHIVYAFMCYATIVFYMSIALENEFFSVALWFVMLPVGISFLLDGKVVFIYSIVSFAIFVTLCFLKYILPPYHIVTLTEKQIYFIDFANFISFFMVFVNTYYCTYRIEKLRTYLEKSEKEIDMESKNREWQKLQTLYYALIKAIEEEKMYENPDLTMPELAEHLKTNQTYIYRALKQNNINESFQNFVNRYRIQAIKDKIDSGLNEQFTIDHLYRMVGFRQQSSFNRIFKQFENITPSEYIRMKKSRERQKQKNNE